MAEELCYSLCLQRTTRETFKNMLMPLPQISSDDGVNAFIFGSSTWECISYIVQNLKSIHNKAISQNGPIFVCKLRDCPMPTRMCAMMQTHHKWKTDLSCPGKGKDYLLHCA
ncbi:hypothetical protein STEG23_001806 [Scotinomys teguina]